MNDVQLRYSLSPWDRERARRLTPVSGFESSDNGKRVMAMSRERGSLLEFGPELRRRRMEAGLSQTEFSELVHFGKGHVCNVENGRKPASLVFARQCDAALEAGGALLALVQRTPAPHEKGGTASTDDSGTEWYMRFRPGGQVEFGTMPGRDLLILEGGMHMTMTPPVPAMGADAPEALAQFRAIFDNLRWLGQHTAPAELVPSLITFTQTLQTRVTHPGMLLLASRFAEFTGWMVQEMGNDRAAVQWTEHAVRLATAGGDHQLIAYRYVRHADVALYRHDAIETIALAQRAQAEQSLPRIHGLAAQREAQGHAIAGDYDACRHALDRAARYMETSHTTPDTGNPILGTSMVADPVAATTGWCLHDLGRSKEAVGILVTELERIPMEAQRARARYTVRLASALACIRELERSCAVLGSILDILPRIDSATVRTDLRQVSRTLNRWNSDHSVKAVMPKITAALRTRVGQ